MKSFVYYYSIAIASVGLFLYGFFPLQQNLSKENIVPPTLLKDIKLNMNELYTQEVDRMVLIVIDALRLDFVTSEHMPFLVSSYKQDGCFLTVKVESPTVTLPRIKSLTTGSIPQFADIIFNLAGTEKHSNSFLHNAAEANKSVIFHGDDTWVKLYSDTFKRFEGFSTYYVNDFNEVDSNITRNVRIELKNEDWDIMVLHYSGLDHIGHVQGPFSNLVHPKLREMDDIIKELSEESKTWKGKRTLIAVTGDHGMKNSGGHGGATYEETHIPLVLLGVPCYNCLIAQSDIPTTLSALLGLVLPASGIGCVASSVLVNYTYERLLYILRYNAIVLLNKHDEGASLFNLASESHYDYLKGGNENDARKAKKLYENCTRSISKNLIHSSIKQEEYILLLSGSVLINCLSIIVNLLVIDKNRLLDTLFLILIIILYPFLPETYFLKEFLLCVTAIYSICNVMITLKALVGWIYSNTVNFMIILTLLHSVSLMSSSFMEEEHQVWYFFYGTFLMVQYYKSIFEQKSLYWLLLFMLLRVLRTVNQTGDKWAHLPDLTDWLLSENNYYYLQVLHCFSLAAIWILNKENLSAAILFLIYIFHVCSSEWSAFMGKTIWLCIILTFCYNILKSNKYSTNIVTKSWVLICALLLRPHNTIFIPACIYTSRIICKYLSHNLVSLILIHIWIGKVFFFCQGHSNSLASIEISSGYVGLNEYNSFVATVQILCHTYAFPVLSTLLILNNSSINHHEIWLYNAAYQLLVTVSTCILIFVHRHHLFIWTVFAPKLVFEACHSVVLLLQMALFYFVIFVKTSLENKK